MTNKTKVLEYLQREYSSKELTTNCELELTEELLDWAKIVRVIAYNPKNGRMYCQENDGSVFWIYEKKLKYKILGHPPTLNELLRALGDKTKYSAWEVVDEFIYSKDFDSASEVVIFNLTQPLTDIPEDHEMWEKLISILDLK